MAQEFRNRGYTVVEHNYSMYDPVSIIKLEFELTRLGENDVIIGHSLGGIITDTNPLIKAQTLEINSIHSDVAGSSDWLNLNPNANIVRGGHSINLEMVNQLEALIRT